MDRDIRVIVFSATNLDGSMAIVPQMLLTTVEIGGGDVIDVLTGTVAAIVLGGPAGFLLGWAAAKAIDRWGSRRSLGVRTA